MHTEIRLDADWVRTANRLKSDARSDARSDAAYHRCNDRRAISINALIHMCTPLLQGSTTGVRRYTFGSTDGSKRPRGRRLGAYGRFHFSALSNAASCHILTFLMRDPHVAALRYDLLACETDTFDHPPPIGREVDAFRMSLADAIVTFDMKEHFASECDAKRCVEAWLRAWELDAALRSGHPVISFAFKNATVVDRDPPPPGTAQVVMAGSAKLTATAFAASIHITHHTYPDPPTCFSASPDVETMWFRYNGYVDGKEPLTSMAYYCVTVLEQSAGNRRAAANMYCVSKSVLDKLGELTSNVGDGQSARKLSRNGTGRSHTLAEIKWIVAAVRALIRRTGEYDADPTATLPELTLDDLPGL